MHAYLSEMRSSLVPCLCALSLHNIILSHHIFLIQASCLSLSQDILNILPLGMDAVIELASTRSVRLRSREWKFDVRCTPQLPHPMTALGQSHPRSPHESGTYHS